MTAKATAATAAYQKADAAHYLHPFTDSARLGRTARIIERGDGVYFWDSDGNKILDGMSGLWCVNIGYGRAEMAAAAAAQMRRLPYYNSFFQCATPPAIRLAEQLADIAPPGFNRVFFTGSGSEANDTVIRMVRRYWELRGEPRRRIFISRHNAYHGSTIAAASLGGMAAMHAQGGLPMADIAHIRQPYVFGEGAGVDAGEFGRDCARALADKIEELGPENVAAFIGEPVQGAGGVIIPPDTYWPAINEVCARYGIILAADEVICGFGRLGHWFGGERFGIRAQIMPIAKGLTSGYLPMGGVLVHDDIADILVKKCGEFAHGFTYSGHPACAAVALENLRILREEDIVRRVREDIAPYFQRQWAALGAHPLAGEARSVGMMAALELAHADGRRFGAAGEAGARCRDLAAARGLVMRACGDTMVIAPPLVITRAQIDELTGKAKSALDALAAEMDGGK